MSLVDQITAMIGSTEDRWSAEKLQVVNWGGFHGHAFANFAPEVTVISGQSGAGKSTLLDAYIALMMPTNVPFNGASNDTGGGRARSADQRNLVSYLRGKLDDTLEDGEVVDDVMRGRGVPTWGAVSMTFVSDGGEKLTAIRAYYLPARAVRMDGGVMRMMTIEGEFDLRELGEFAKIGDKHFPPLELKAVWPALRTYDSYASFSQALFVKLGIGMSGDGTNALRLLARIQASEDITTVDKLYKELVIEKPDSYERADDAIVHFDRLEDVYQEMVTAQKRAEMLEPITELHTKLTRSQAAIDDNDELGALDSDGTPAGLWRLRKHSHILSVAVDSNRAEAQAVRARRTALAAHETSLKTQLADATKAHSAAGGDVLNDLAGQIDVAAQTVARKEERRAALVSATMVLGSPLATKAEFEDLQREGNEFLTGEADEAARLRAERDKVMQGNYPRLERRRAIKTELASLSSRAGRVDQYLDEMRKLAANASGLPIEDLPFVAELIDVKDGEQGWRIAIETALHGGARLMLVPLEDLERFSRAIDPLHLRGRLNFEGVARSAMQHVPEADPRHIAGKLQFKDSPYQGWVAEYVSHRSRNALCVMTPEDLAGEGLRITVNGQTRRGRGGSHGRQSLRNVIGFDNTDLRAELDAEVAELDALIADVDRTASGLDANAGNLAKKRAAFERIVDQLWPDIDVDSAAVEKQELTRRRDELRDNNDLLATLDDQIEQLGKTLDGVQRDRHKADDETVILDALHVRHVDAEDRVNPVIQRLDQEGAVIVRAELAKDLDALWEDVRASDPETPELFGGQIMRLAKELSRRSDTARDEVKQTTQQVELIFRTYHRQWDDENLGTTIDYFDDYAAVLEEIVHSGLRERRQEWRRRVLEWSGQHLQQLSTALGSAIEEIEARLDPINQILRNLPFGATSDRLFIDLRKLKPEAVLKFRRDLNVHAKMATKGLSDEALERAFNELRRFMAQIRLKGDRRLPSELVDTVDRDRLLDVRRHVEISAQRQDIGGTTLSVFKSLQGKSGGEMQELIAFIVGSALRFQLGDQNRETPRFAPVFLDEGFIKADGQFTSRAVQAWRGLGFQLIIGAPVDKAPSLEPDAEIIVEIAKNLTTHRSYVLEMRGLARAVVTA